MNVTITSKEKYRNFPEGYIMSLDYNDADTIYLMGINGCGKSTIIQALRGYMNSNEDKDTKWNAHGVCQEILSHFDVKVDGFNDIYHIDIDGLDDTHSMFNAGTAGDFIQNGGWAFNRVSSGERVACQLSRLKKWVDDKEDSLIVFDEVDDHLDYQMKLRFPKLLNRLFQKSKKLIVTHDILMATVNEGPIAQFAAQRTMDAGVQLIGKTPSLWVGDQKITLFEIISGHTVSKDNPEI